MKKNVLLFFALLVSLTLRAQNLVKNGSFENDFTDWYNQAGSGSVAAFSVQTVTVQEGTKAYKVEVTTPGANHWDVQSINSAFPSEQGVEYKLTFFAKASTAGLVFRTVLQSDVYASYAEKSHTLTTDWKEYQWIFTAQEKDLRLRLNIHQAGSFYIDNIQLVPTATGPAAFQVNTQVKHQKMEGFGGALAFYDNWVAEHPNREEMYKLLWNDLGLDWLRLKNNYRNEPTFQQPYSVEFAQKAKAYTEDSVRIFMSSWSPPANLKSNNQTNNGTLKKENGKFVYGAFADYWKNALVNYTKLGINPSWISIQNEPDWLTDEWETNKFTPRETADFPGYDKALDSVYAKIKGLSKVPKLLGAEELGIGYNNFNNYTSPIRSKNHLFGYAYHLYHGGDPNQPDSYIPDLRNIRLNYGDKPNMMTEYELFKSGWLKTAWLISNVLTEANTSAFFYWNLIWPGSGLIDIDNPWDQSQWKNAKGYTVNPDYYAFKHFVKHIKPGYKRVATESVQGALRNSAFLSPDERELVMVFVNTGTGELSSKVHVEGWLTSASAIYQSVEGAYYQSKGSLDTSRVVKLPANSITTLVLNRISVPVLLGSIYKITNKNSGKVIEVAKGSTAKAAKVQQNANLNGDYQKWRVEDAGSGYVKLVALHSGKVMDVGAVSSANGASINQYTDLNQNNQKWQFVSTGDGYYRIVSKHSKKSLDIVGRTTSNEARLTQWDYLGLDSQKWKLEEIIVSNVRKGLVLEPVQAEAVRIYPNPVVGEFTVELNGYEADELVQIQVRDLQGRIVYRQSATNQKNTSVKEKLPSGVYMVQVSSKKGVITKKLVVQ